MLALQVALASVLAARFEKLLPILTEEPWDIERTIIIALVVLYVVALIAAIGLAAWVYVPRNPKTGKSILIYFEDIASMEYKAFEERAKQVTPDVIEDHLLDQIHRVSKIASVKMRRVHWAFIMSVPSGVLAIVLVAWSSI